MLKKNMFFFTSLIILLTVFMLNINDNSNGYCYLKKIPPISLPKETTLFDCEEEIMEVTRAQNFQGHHNPNKMFKI